MFYIFPLACSMFVVVTLLAFKQKSVQDILTWIEKKNFSGVVLIADGEKVLYEKGFGFASCDKSVVNSSDTIQAIGSITKMFTEVAIAQLEAKGVLNINNPLSHYLNNIPEDKASITIRHLLEHTSGLRTYHEKSSLGDFEAMTATQAFNEIMRQPVLFLPGTKQHYSNSGYTLLALLIQEVSGMDYRTYIREEILLPVGMRSTGFWGEPLDPIASTPNVILGCSSPDRWNHSWVLVGNGGMVSTTRDLYRWVRALRGSSLLNESAKKSIGLDRLIKHGFGSAGGSSQHQFNATIEYSGQHDITVIAISNRSSLPAEKFGIKLLKSAIREKKRTD
jgi:CubicO group peptidase (beta-lactamase class C family)